MGDMSIKTRGLHYSPMLSTHSISNVSQIPRRVLVRFEKIEGCLEDRKWTLIDSLYNK